MIQKKKVLALIPARGGSKGIKGKNIYPLCGKPLISYTVTESRKSKYIDRVIVSTDSMEIAETAKKYGAEIPFIRPEEFAKDQTKSIEVVLHALEWLKEQGEDYDICVLLQPTQPLRTAEDIDYSLEKFMEMGERGLVSVTEVNDHPILIRKIDENYELQGLLTENSTVRRQDMQSYYRVNGCIYINLVKEINEETSFNDNPIPYIMPRERSVDIDKLSDIALAGYFLNSKGEN